MIHDYTPFPKKARMYAIFFFAFCVLRFVVTVAAVSLILLAFFIISSSGMNLFPEKPSSALPYIITAAIAALEYFLTVAVVGRLNPLADTFRCAVVSVFFALTATAVAAFYISAAPTGLFLGGAEVVSAKFLLHLFALAEAGALVCSLAHLAVRAMLDRRERRREAEL